MKKFKNWVFPEIKHGKPTKYGWTIYYPDYFIMGKNTDIGYGTFINAQHRVVIQKNVQIGPFSAILSGNTIDDVFGEIIIEEGSRIGAYSLILPNSHIKKDSYIKARSIVYSKKGITYVKEVINCCRIRRVDR